MSVLLIFAVISAGGCGRKEAAKPEEAPKLLSGTYRIAGVPGADKLRRDTLRYVEAEQTKTFTGTANPGESFTAVTFPFSFKIIASYVKVDDRVAKGDDLFLVESESMNEAVTRYRNTGDQQLLKTLRSMGINPDNGDDISQIRIISPADGRIAGIHGITQNIPASALAVIQTKQYISITVQTAAGEITDNTRFTFQNNNVSYSLKTVSLSTENEKTTARLSLESPAGIIDATRFPVTAVTTLQNVFILSRNAVFERNGKNYCLVELSSGLAEQREIEGFRNNDNAFIVRNGLKDGETVLNDDLSMLLKQLNI